MNIWKTKNLFNTTPKQKFYLWLNTSITCTHADQQSLSEWEQTAFLMDFLAVMDMSVTTPLGAGSFVDPPPTTPDWVRCRKGKTKTEKRQKKKERKRKKKQASGNWKQIQEYQHINIQLQQQSILYKFVCMPQNWQAVEFFCNKQAASAVKWLRHDSTPFFLY